MVQFTCSWWSELFLIVDIPSRCVDVDDCIITFEDYMFLCSMGTQQPSPCEIQMFGRSSKTMKLSAWWSRIAQTFSFKRTEVWKPGILDRSHRAWSSVMTARAYRMRVGRCEVDWKPEVGTKTWSSNERRVTLQPRCGYRKQLINYWKISQSKTRLPGRVFDNLLAVFLRTSEKLFANFPTWRPALSIRNFSKCRSKRCQKVW